MKLDRNIGVQGNYEVLEYIKWDKFLNVIDKAKQACKNSEQEPDDHFPRVEKLVEIGSGAKRDIGHYSPRKNG